MTEPTLDALKTCRERVQRRLGHRYLLGRVFGRHALRGLGPAMPREPKPATKSPALTARRIASAFRAALTSIQARPIWASWCESSVATLGRSIALTSYSASYRPVSVTSTAWIGDHSRPMRRILRRVCSTVREYRAGWIRM